MGVGNFFGMLPEEMRNSRLSGVELDPVSGRIAKQLYPKADITVGGFETTDRRDFFDLAIEMCIRDRTYDATVVLEDDGQYANFKLEFDQWKGGLSLIHI